METEAKENTPTVKATKAIPQDVQKPHLTPEQFARRNRVDLWALKDGLNAIRAVRDVMDYLGEETKPEGVNAGIIFAGFGEALKVVYDRMSLWEEASEQTQQA